MAAGKPIEEDTYAERWRLAGERLRAKSPELFEAMLALLATYAVADYDQDLAAIDRVYLSC